MYRGYIQNFRIFGAVIIFLQIPKFSALFKSENNKTSLFFSFLLTDSPTPLVSDPYRSRRSYDHWPAQNAPTVTLRRGRPNPNDLHTPTNPSPPFEWQKAHRRRLHAGHGGLSTMAHGVTPAMA